MPPRMHIFNNIRTTHAATGTELFYGASSVFSLLQHLDVHLPSQPASAPHSQPGVDEVHDGDESIQRYNHQNIAFDCIPQPTCRATQSVFIGQDLARAALRNFLLTAHHLTPFLEPTRLSSTLEKLYTPSENPSLAQADRALVVVAMATGAALAKDSPCREHLLAQARAETESMLYAISLKAVQVALLMAQCEFESGNPNISYLQLGSAVRKAFAAGIHRATSLEVKQTMWALYCAESMVCFMIGRNPGMAEADIVAPTLEQPSYMGSFVRLCTIVRSAYRLYRPDTTMTIANDMSRANDVYQQLLGFSSSLKEDLSLEIGGQLYALTGKALSWHVTTSFCTFSRCGYPTKYSPTLSIPLHHPNRVSAFRPARLRAPTAPANKRTQTQPRRRSSRSQPRRPRLPQLRAVHRATLRFSLFPPNRCRGQSTLFSLFPAPALLLRATNNTGAMVRASTTTPSSSKAPASSSSSPLSTATSTATTTTTTTTTAQQRSASATSSSSGPAWRWCAGWAA